MVPVQDIPVRVVPVSMVPTSMFPTLFMVSISGVSGIPLLVNPASTMSARQKGFSGPRL